MQVIFLEKYYRRARGKEGASVIPNYRTQPFLCDVVKSNSLVR